MQYLCCGGKKYGWPRKLCSISCFGPVTFQRFHRFLATNRRIGQLSLFPNRQNPTQNEVVAEVVGGKWQTNLWTEELADKALKSALGRLDFAKLGLGF